MPPPRAAISESSKIFGRVQRVQPAAIGLPAPGRSGTGRNAAAAVEKGREAAPVP